MSISVAVELLIVIGSALVSLIVMAVKNQVDTTRCVKATGKLFKKTDKFRDDIAQLKFKEEANAKTIERFDTSIKVLSDRIEALDHSIIEISSSLKGIQTQLAELLDRRSS